MTRCAITGGNGFVGGALAGALAEADWRVVVMTRSAGKFGRERIPFALDGSVEPGLLEGIDVLIHCAWDFSYTRWPDIQRVNIEGTRRLLQAADAAKIPCVVLISSMSAYPGCASLYGRAKLECETIALNTGAVVIRPGLVCSEPNGGIFGAIETAVRRLPIVPVITGGRQILFTCHTRDLAGLILEISELEAAPAGPIVAANATPWTLSTLVKAISRAHGLRRVLFPVPWQIPWMFLRSLETFGFGGTFRSDSVFSLVRQNPDPDFTKLAPYSTDFRPYAS